ncbi:MAG: caspase family protein [Elusimicrobia bacterium]|nr:caspase family protein [Elusimicrobiota bacterium]
MEKAVMAGNHDGVRNLLRSGVSAESRNKNWGFSRPILLAAERGDLKMIQLLVEGGAKLDPDDTTPLTVAAMSGHRDACRYFIGKGLSAEKVIDMLERNPNWSGAANGVRMLQSLQTQSPVPTTPAVIAGSAPLWPAFPAPSFASPERPDDLAIIVGIESYSDIASKAPYAERDADAFKAHVRALGVPERNVVLLKGSKAVRSALTKNVEGWLPRMVKPDSRVYFFFSGHGAPDVKTGQAYLVPWDGDPNFLDATAYPVAKLYKKLGELPAKQVLVAMDSCFSGAGGRSVLASGARPLVGRIDTGAVPARITVLAASAGNEISGSLDDKGHGAFTYFLLEGLNAGKNTPKDLNDYLTPRVQDEARRLNRDQTPQLQGDGGWPLR